LSQNSELVQRDEEDGKWSDAPKAQDWAPTMRGNPFLLWEYAPGQRTESDTDVNINSLGLRGPEPTIPKPDGIRRLLSTGDSTIYGFKVRDGSVFIDIAAEKLGPDVEGWNAAIPGYSSYQSLNMLEMRALKLEPDVIVIGNIWSDNNFDTFVDKELLEVYSLFQSGTVNHLWGILEKSAIFRVLDYRLRLNQDRDLTEREKRSRARKVGWTVGGQDQNSGKRRVAANDYATNLNSLIDLAPKTLKPFSSRSHIPLISLMTGKRPPPGPSTEKSCKTLPTVAACLWSTWSKCFKLLEKAAKPSFLMKESPGFKTIYTLQNSGTALWGRLWPQR
jgi:hypothetical protein